MVNEHELLDRFGDVEFVHELWSRVRSEIPQLVTEIGLLVQETDQRLQVELVGKLHKLRGLVSNFLTEGHAVDLLIQCENEVQANQTSLMMESWRQFQDRLNSESSNLDSWLKARGFA